MGRNDFLDQPQAVEAPRNADATTQAISAMGLVLADIRRELMKQNPEVLATTRVQGNNKIATSDTDNHKVYFEVGGKTITAYLLLIYSTFSGNVAVSVNGMANQNDGIVFAAGDLIVLPISVDSVYVMTDGSADCPINGPADKVDGGLTINAFTIPDYDRQRYG